jgi:cytidine deaminase
LSKTDELITPCGACRQWIVELAPHALIGMLGNEGIERWCTPEELLPWAFGAEFFHHHT